MANYFWLPYYDESWNLFLNLRAGVNENAKILPYSNGGHGYSGFAIGDWSDVNDDDRLQIATHGRKYTTDTVAWVCPGGFVTWTPAQMADVLQGFLGDKRIHYELLACFGANSWGLASSFAEKLAADMRGANMRGTLTALKGATNIGAGQGRQTGTSRITTGMKMPWKVHGKVIKPGGTDPRGPLSSDSTVKWNLT